MKRTHRGPRVLRLLFATALATVALQRGAVARGDDLADEADLQFEIGTQRYRARDFQGALEHFLASNRLVANRNVVFNIALTYEQLNRFPDAHRYYIQALEGEADPAARNTLDNAIRRVAPHVAVIRVVTDPPGATLYIDRRDLGPRGNSPRTLGFRPGRYRVIAELDGYEPAESPEIDARLGTESPVTLRLNRILGRIRVEGSPAGATVRVDDERAPPVGTVPCELSLPPGRHTLHATLEGYQPTALDVDVLARQVVTVRPRMAPLTGSLVVSTDERDALVEVDGRPVGFTPAVVNVQVGVRRVRISLGGFRAVEETVTVRATEQNRVAAQLRQVEEVSAASRTTESVEDAPGSVSIVPSLELRAMGYPTIVEAMRGVRGLYVSDDRSYPTVGFRGFARPGDYGNRVLVLLDGHPTNDNWINSSYVSYDARTDLDDIERIEVVRGPGSVLYGTGAFSGVINLVSRHRNAPTSVFAGASTNEYGVARARVGFNLRLGADAGIWTSLAGAHSAGRDFFFPELATDADPPGESFNGNVIGADHFDAGTLQGRLWWRSFTLQWLLHSRRKHLPTGAFESTLGDPRTQFVDTRGLLELRFEPRLTRTFQLMTRGFVNYYGYDSALPRSEVATRPAGMAMGDRCVPLPMGMGPVGGLRCLSRDLYTERYQGVWGGAEGRFVLSPSPRLRLTAGVEGQVHLAADMQGFVVHEPSGPGAAGRPAPQPSTYLDERSPYQILAAYGLADFVPLDSLRLSLGARLDNYFTSTCSQIAGTMFPCPEARRRSFNSGVNPRAAVILRPYARGNLKLLAGRAFRAPSVYEFYYNDNGETQVQSPELSPETIWSGEAELSHRFSTTWTALVAPYFNYINDLIVSRGEGSSTDPTHYRNSPAPVLTVGTEFELRREWRQGWMFAAALSYQRSQYLQSDASRQSIEFREVPNAPELLGSLRAAVPLVPRRLTVASRLTFEGPRWDKFDLVSDSSPQQRTDPAFVWDLALSGELDRFGLRYVLGVYNLFDWRYQVPVSREYPQRALVQNGRTVLASVSIAY